MANSIISLSIAGILPTILSIILYFCDTKNGLSKIPYWAKQVCYGILFGGIAVLGTEWGIPMNGAMVNCRDAAVLSAGLFFGAPAGIIAGVIGGVERWFAVYWGVGTVTRVACTASTIFAGFYAAWLRKRMFEDKKPGVVISFAIGVVMEVIHLTMIFLTNMNDPDMAAEIVKNVTAPMLLGNGGAVFLCAIVISLLYREKLQFRHVKASISQTIQRWLLVTVTLAFLATTLFVFSLQTGIADNQAETALKVALDEVSKDIIDASDSNILDITGKVANSLKYSPVRTVAEIYDLAEVSLIGPDGLIYESNVEEYLGFDMKSGSQSGAFMVLLDDVDEYVQEYMPTTNDPNISRKYAGIKYGDGFLQIGYDAEQFQKNIADKIVWLAKNKSVGETGFLIMVDKQLNLLSAPEDVNLSLLDGEAKAIGTQDEGVVFSGIINATPSKCMYRITEGYYIVAVLPDVEAYRIRNVALYVNSFMEILVFAILFAMVYMLIKNVVVNQLSSVNKSLSKITNGDLNEVVNVRTNAEFASLSDDINMTVDTLKNYIAEAAARIDKELEFAKNIQASSLPSVFPAFPKRKDLDIFAIMDPAKEVGGDFYDFYFTNENTLNFLIADVSGKGIPAAMFMMRAKTELKSLTETDMPLGNVFTTGNNDLCEGNDAGMFVTAWQGSVDLTTGHVKFANAGHNAPLVRHSDGRFEFLKSKVGFVLAGMEDIQYKEQELDLLPGDIVFLYTDGVTEATNANMELFGDNRLLEAVNEIPFTNVKNLCEEIKRRVDEFVGEAPQFDDITMVAFQYIGTAPDPSICIEEAKTEDVLKVTEFIETELEKNDIPMKTVVQINISIDEIFSNIVKYGYAGTKGPVWVSLNVDDIERKITITFVDEGVPYNPVVKEDPDVTLSAEERQIGGLGIFLVKKTMDDMRYRYEDEKNILTICKKY